MTVDFASVSRHLKSGVYYYVTSILFCESRPFWAVFAFSPQKKTALLRERRFFRPSKSLAEFAADAANTVGSFFAGACTWKKIHIRLQVWNLFAVGEQIMRAADCKKLAEKPEGFFRQAQKTALLWERRFYA